MSMNGKIDEIENIETFERFFAEVSYEALYALPTEEFFKQVMIRDRYFSAIKSKLLRINEIDYKPEFLPLLKRILKGYVIFDENIFEKYTPKKIKILPHYPPRGIRPLSFEKSVEISSNLLGLVDLGYLTFKEEPKENKSTDNFNYSPKQEAMSDNIGHTTFFGQPYQDVINQHSYIDEKQIKEVFIEVDINTPEEELVKNFKEIIRTRKKLYEHIDKPTERAKIIIKKCERYKVIEAYDIKKSSELLKIKLLQKDLSSIIFKECRDGKGLDDYRNTTKEYMEKIFNHSYYTQFLK
tara:strand:+ start:1414 stop:2301 length:888 start_codon:yes stop_codon:yes gene_type:complete